MLIGGRDITTGDTRRYEVNYQDFLQHGDTISSFTVTTTAPTSRIGTTSRNVTNTSIFFLLTAGTVGEAFTVAVRVVTALGETVNDTLEFKVVAA